MEKKKKTPFPFLIPLIILIDDTVLSTWLSGKESANAGVTGDMGSILGSGRSPGEGNGYPLHIGYLLLPTASLLMNINLFLVVNSINTFVISSFALIYAQSFFIDCAIIGTVNCFYLKLLIHMKLTLMCIRR